MWPAAKTRNFGRGVSTPLLYRETTIGRKILTVAILLLIRVDLAYGWPWSTDMARQPSIRSQRSPRLPPENSIPRQGIEPSMDRVEAGKILRNPVAPNPTSLADGKGLFQIYCVPCHGVDAKGTGPVAKKFVTPTDLTSQATRDRPDGFIYETIRDGGSSMPPQGDAISPNERWDIVNYLRSIQQK